MKQALNIQQRIDDIEEWVAGNVSNDGYDAMALTVLLRGHLEGAFDDGVEAAEKDFLSRRTGE